MADQHERTSGRLLLHRLLDYIHEHAKEPSRNWREFGRWAFRDVVRKVGS